MSRGLSLALWWQVSKSSGMFYCKHGVVVPQGIWKEGEEEYMGKGQRQEETRGKERSKVERC